MNPFGTITRIVNPYRNDPRFAVYREKWGEITVTADRDYLHRCSTCDATWIGSIEDEECQWCERREQAREESEVNRLLYPQWWDWGDRYRELPDKYREVWRATRGIHGDYLKSWERKLTDALTAGRIN